MGCVFINVGWGSSFNGTIISVVVIHPLVETANVRDHNLVVNGSHVVLKMFWSEFSSFWGLSVSPEVDLNALLWLAPHVNKMLRAVFVVFLWEEVNTNVSWVESFDLLKSSSSSWDTNGLQSLLVGDKRKVVSLSESESLHISLFEGWFIWNLWSNEFENNIAASIHDETIVGLFVITLKFQSSEWNAVGIELLDVIIKFWSIKLSIVVHEWMILLEVSPLGSNHVFNILEWVFTIWMVGAVDGVNSESSKAGSILKLESSLSCTFTFTTWAVIRSFFSWNVFLDESATAYGITCSPCWFAHTVTHTLSHGTGNKHC